MAQTVYKTSRRAFVRGNPSPQPFNIVSLSDVVFKQEQCNPSEHTTSLTLSTIRGDETGDELAQYTPRDLPIDNTTSCSAEYCCHLPISTLHDSIQSTYAQLSSYRVSKVYPGTFKLRYTSMCY